MEYFEQKREEIAASLIQNWKRDESALSQKYASRAEYFTAEMCQKLWADPKVRSEMGTFEALQAFIENEHRAHSHKKGIHRYTRADADEHGDSDPLETKCKIAWEADPKLREEFNDDFEAYSQYERNKSRVRTFA